MGEPISPELVSVDPELAAAARAALPEEPWQMLTPAPAPQPAATERPGARPVVARAGRSPLSRPLWRDRGRKHRRVQASERPPSHAGCRPLCCGHDRRDGDGRAAERDGHGSDHARACACADDAHASSGAHQEHGGAYRWTVEPLRGEAYGSPVVDSRFEVGD